MKVRELLAKLKNANPDAEVIGCCENPLMKVFEIESVEVADLERVRLSDGGPAGIAFGKTDASSPHVLVTLTEDF